MKEYMYITYNSVWHMNSQSMIGSTNYSYSY